MSTPILVTKLFLPAIRPEFVSRLRLIEQLNEGLRQDHGFGRKLTLVSAPAGFGKTTLVAEWLKTNPLLPSHAAAWLSLDEGDNDPTRFLTYLVAALNRSQEQETLGEESLAALQSPQPAGVEAVLTPLINEIAALPSRIILVLDDYHLMDNQAIHQTLTFLIENLPPQLHLVITTREDPLLPLARWRARGQLSELRAADLRFTAAETAEFLNRVMGLCLSDQDIAALGSRTEGWIAGLQLAAISLQGSADPTKLINAFTGSNRLVLDYLIEEVLQRQTAEIQDFLLKTSILDRLSGPACDAVTGQNHSQAILEMLERANLFIIPLDSELQWYRYHHLFADLLQQRLQHLHPEWADGLHLRASAWCEQNGLLDEAVRHALSAEDFERAVALLAGLADPLWERGEHVKLRLWLSKLPEKWLCIQPLLCIYHAWFLFSTGHQNAAQAYLQTVEDTLEIISDPGSQEMPSSQVEADKIRGRLGAIGALIATWKEDMPGIVRQAGLALQYLPPGDPWRFMAAMSLGDARYYQGDVQASYQTRLQNLAECRAEDNLFFYMIANLKVATSLREMGQLDKTIEICRQQLDFARKHNLLQTIFVGWALALYAIALAERNELDQALEYAERSLALTRGGDFAFASFSHIVLAKTHFYRGDLPGAQAALQKLAEIHRNQYMPYHISVSLAGWQARLMLAHNRLSDAAAWIAAQDCDGDARALITYDHVIVVRARLLLAQGKLDEASSLLTRLRAACESAGHTARLIEILTLQALTQQAAGMPDMARQLLAHALTLAEPGGYVRVFVDEGPPMAHLLYELLSQGIATDYIQRLLTAFPDFKPKQALSLGVQSPDGQWIEPLSERELEVLQLIADGLANQEIASQLYLSLNTVKAHTRSIYGKLGVNNRTQAGVRARALGLFTDN